MPAEAEPSRRSLLPVYLALPRMPKGFGLPRWAEAARNYLFCAFIIVSVQRSAPAVSKVMVAFGVFMLFTLVLCVLPWMLHRAIAALMLVRRKIGRTTEVPAPQWGEDIVSVMGGGMGLIPNVMFLVWGLSYLDIYHIPRIGLVAVAVWGSWFVLGCLVAVVNGVGQWWRGRHVPPGVAEG